MKTKSIRIYSEEELLQKAKQAEAMLRRVFNPDTGEVLNTDLRALHDALKHMFILYKNYKILKTLHLIQGDSECGCLKLAVEETLCCIV